MIDWGKALAAAGVGALDEVMISWDEKEGRTEDFKTATDIVRLLGTGLGYGLQAFTRQARYGEALALSMTPLFVKSVAGPIRDAIGGGSSSTADRVFMPRKRTPVAARSRYPAPAYDPELQGVALD